MCCVCVSKPQRLYKQMMFFRFVFLQFHFVAISYLALSFPIVSVCMYRCSSYGGQTWGEYHIIIYFLWLTYSLLTVVYLPHITDYSHEIEYTCVWSGMCIACYCILYYYCTCLFVILLVCRCTGYVKRSKCMTVCELQEGHDTAEIGNSFYESDAV